MMDTPLDNKAVGTLELAKVRELLAKQAVLAPTKERALALMPSDNMYEVLRRQHETSDARSFLERRGGLGLSAVSDIAAPLARAEKGGVLTLRELLDIRMVLRLARELRARGGGEDADVYETLTPLFRSLSPNRSFEERIELSVISEDELADAASPELADIRRHIRNATAKVRDILQSFIRSSTTQKYMQEPIITIRNDRYVIPIRSEHRGDVPGLVHDSSQSGATIFIEPMAVVEANNQLKLLRAQEQDEIERILARFTDEALRWKTQLTENYAAICELDFIFAKGLLSAAMTGVEPAVSEDGPVELKKARHPLLDPHTVVPVDITLGGSCDTLIVTGPNTGGKTVSLKTLGLLQLMAQAGLHIPVREDSRVRVFSHVLPDIGDRQSIEQSLSTFSSHMENIVDILRLADGRSLVLFDELGAGTDPVEGAALGVAIIGSLRGRGTLVMATTHYAELKMYALQTEGVENASCEFDVETLTPTFRLLTGVPGKSNAFAISRRLGLPEDIVERAGSLISSENVRFEDILSDLERSRQEMEKAKAEADALRAEAKAMQKSARLNLKNIDTMTENELQRARDKARDILDGARWQARRAIDEAEAIKKELKEKKELADTKAARRGILSELDSAEDKLAPSVVIPADSYINPRPLRVGDTVELRNIGTRGTVLSAPDKDGNVTVQAGIIKTKLHQNGLKLVEDAQTETAKNVMQRMDVKRGAAAAPLTTLDIRGQTVDEAEPALDKFLDDASLGHLEEVTIIHGKGTGVLRQAVHDFLRRNPHVKTFRLGVYGEGETGVTIVELGE